MWRSTTDKKYGVAIYNFKSTLRHGLWLEIGETVQILEEYGPGKWYRGFSTRNKNVKGIFPATYVHIIECKVDPDGMLETITPIENPFVTEVTYVLREWSHIWKNHFKVSHPPHRSVFMSIRQVMIELMDCRCQLKSGTCTQEQAREVEMRIAKKIDWGNKRLGLDLVPRIDGMVVDPDKISPVELYALHVASTKMSEGVTSGSIRKTVSKRILAHHLYLSLKSFGASCGEDMEVYFALYDAKEAKFISERVLFKFPKGELPATPLKIPQSCLYTDLGNADLMRDMYLVAHIYRIGRMLPNESSRSRTHASAYRRPWGCAVQGVRDMTMISFGDADSEKDFNMRITSIDEKAEKDFPQLHENLIKKQSSKGSVLASNMLVTVRMLHGELPQVKRENPLLLRNIPLALKQGFPDIILPGDVRNDIYLYLSRGELGEKYGASTNVSQKTVEVKVVVLDTNGRCYQDCIHGAVGDGPLSDYKSCVFYHSNNPRWNETIKITLPTEKFEGCHVRFEFRHCSTKDRGVEKKLFAFSFMKLMKSDGITVKDGSHELYCYKCEDVSKLKQEYYINLPSSGEDVNLSAGTTGGNTFFSRCQKDNITVETRLCSTKLTQNVDLLGLLKWREHPNRIKEYLDKAEGLSGDEIVKMLQDILDAIFSIFSEAPVSGGQAHVKAAFHTLVHILLLLQEQKYEHFKPVLDTYVKESFSSSLVYRDLMRSLIETIEGMYTPAGDKLEEAERVFKSLTFLFKFIVQSRILYQRASGGHSTDEQFREELFTLFNCMYSMLHSTSQQLINVQSIFLENIITVHEVLVRLIPVTDIASFMCCLVSRIPRDGPAKLVNKKLECIQKLVNTDLFIEEDARSEMIGMCMSQVKHYFIKKPVSEDQVGLCAEIIRDILIVVKRQCQAEQDIHKDVGQLVNSNLDVMVNLVQAMATQMSKQTAGKSGAVAGKLVSCLIGLLKIMEESHYHDYLGSYPSKAPLKDFLVGIMSVFRLLVQQHVFPKDWIVMRFETDNTIFTAMHYFSDCLHQEFLCNDFNQELWTLYFQVAVNFLTQQSLQLEMYTDAKKDKVLNTYGDMRVRMGFEIISMWQTLGEHKIKFVPRLVGPFLQVTLIAETTLRRAMLPLFIDMMDCEQKHQGNFKMVETELIDKLDIEVSQNKGDDEYKELFNTILLEHVQKEPSWQTNGTQFIKSVTSLLERLLDYRNVLDGEENRGKKMTCTYNLLNFYKTEFQREEMYIRYIYKLCDLHLSARDFTEAGFTLKLHADMLEWGDKMLHAEGSYQAQREWERKELLYQKIIEYFNQGKSWEYGIPLCKELASLYEKKFDYAKLSSILQTQATFFQNILTSLRQGSSYYRVGFYGRRFPLFLRNKIFIYRGDEFEKLSPFTRRLQSEFPNAELLTTLDPPDNELKNSDMQYIQISNVHPIPSDKVEFRGQMVPEQIMSFYKKNEVTKFESRRPFHKGVKNKENEFKTLCLEITTDEISNQLPGILRWFEVVNSVTSVLSPVENAADTVKSMNKVLKSIVTSFTKDPSQILHPFTMKLNGVVDAAVNGGITKYKEAFFSTEFAVEQPEEAHNIRNLKVAFGEQVEILRGALILHGRLASTEMQPLHKNMLSMFANMEKSIMEDVPKIDPRQISGMSQTSLLDQPNCDSAYSSPRVSVSSANNLLISSSITSRLPTPSENTSVTDSSTTERRSDSYLYKDDDNIYEAPFEKQDSGPVIKEKELPKADEKPPPLPQRLTERKTKGHTKSEPFPPSYPDKPVPKSRQTISSDIRGSPNVSPITRLRKGSVPHIREENIPPNLPARNKHADAAASPLAAGDSPDGAPALPARINQRKISLPSPLKGGPLAIKKQSKSVEDREEMKTPPPLPPTRPTPTPRKSESGESLSTPPPLPPRPGGSIRSPASGTPSGAVNQRHSGSDKSDGEYSYM